MTTDTLNLDRLLRLSEAAALSGLPERTLRAAIQAGLLRATDVGTGQRHHYRITGRALYEYVTRLQETCRDPF